MDKLKDAKIAVEKHGWKWVNMHGIRDILVPPDDSPMRMWTAMWDENGIPHYLPEYSKADKLEEIKNRWGNIDGMGIAHPILEDELSEDVNYLIQLIEKMKDFIESNEFDLTPEFRRYFPNGIK